MSKEVLKNIHGEKYYLSDDGYYSNGSFFPNNGSNLFPIEMRVGGIYNITRRTRAYIIGVRFKAMQKRDSLQIEQFMVYD